MKHGNPENLGVFLLKGLIVGLVATQALDLIGSYIYENEDPKLREEENAVRDHRQAYEVGVAKIARVFGRTLSKAEEQVWGWRFHKTFGIIGGIQYLALRNRNQKIAAGWGLAYGASFFLVADEILIYLAKLTPGPSQFDWRVHARGAIAHTAYGVAAETTIRAIEALPKLLIPEDKLYLRAQ